MNFGLFAALGDCGAPWDSAVIYCLILIKKIKNKQRASPPMPPHCLYNVLSAVISSPLEMSEEFWWGFFSIQHIVELSSQGITIPAKACNFKKEFPFFIVF